MKIWLKPYWILPLLAFAISLVILFVPPYPGVSDHGDFHRVMKVTGLHVESEAPEIGKSGFVQTFYQYDPFPTGRLFQIQPTSSIIYPIAASRILKTAGILPYFTTHVLSVVLVFLYCAAFWLFLLALYKMKPLLSWVCGALGIFILFDAGYLVFTNSLYQEAIMFIGLFWVLSITAYFLAQKPKLGVLPVAGFFAACCFFLLSKAQVISLLPIIAILFGVLCWKYAKSVPVRICTVVGLCLLVLLTVRFYQDQRLSQAKCTTYNSIFYGILDGSQTPRQDLLELGLSPELAQDQGKHAFLPTEQYVCPPYSAEADAMIYEKVSTFDVALFYMKHPTRLIDAMQYTADRSFNTTGFLGKYQQNQVPEYTENIGRFTLYSDLRKEVPKNIFFVIGLFLAALAYSIGTLIRTKNSAIRSMALLLLMTLLFCLFQFPLPVFGNGHADTMKQMYLFNYSFDCGILFWVGCLLLQISSSINKRRRMQAGQTVS